MHYCLCNILGACYEESWFLFTRLSYPSFARQSPKHVVLVVVIKRSTNSFKGNAILISKFGCFLATLFLRLSDAAAVAVVLELTSIIKFVVTGQASDALERENGWRKNNNNQRCHKYVPQLKQFTPVPQTKTHLSAVSIYAADWILSQNGPRAASGTDHNAWHQGSRPVRNPTRKGNERIQACST